MATRERSVSRTLFLPAISLFSAFQMAPSFFSLSSSFFSYVGPISFPFSLSIPVHTQMYIFARKTGNVCVSLSLSPVSFVFFSCCCCCSCCSVYSPKLWPTNWDPDGFLFSRSLSRAWAAGSHRWLPSAGHMQDWDSIKLLLLHLARFSLSLSLSPSHWLCHYDRDHQEPTDHLLIATKLYSPLYFFLSLSFFLLYFATTTSVCHGMYTFRLTFSLSRSFPPVGDSVSACWLHGCCLAFPFLFFFPSPSSSLFVFRTTFMSLIHRVLYGTRYFLSLTHSHKTIFKAVFFFFLFCPLLCLFDVL